MRLLSRLIPLLAILAAQPAGTSIAAAQAGRGPNAAIEVHRDLVYGTPDGTELRLDLYVPRTEAPSPLVIWVHGGAWRSGSKADLPDLFATSGYATASLDFRQSTEARFPAAIHDIKAAIRFLRAMASTYGYAADRIAIAGSSSGGHLAALVGVTGGHPALEGTIGPHTDQSSSVQAIISYYGASNLQTILSQSTPFGLSVRVPALELLLGALPDSVPELARLASPVSHVDSSDPPLLLLHGDQDPQMPINQSHELVGAYERLRLNVSFYVLYGAKHESAPFFAPEQSERVLDFLTRTIGAPGNLVATER